MSTLLSLAEARAWPDAVRTLPVMPAATPAFSEIGTRPCPQPRGTRLAVANARILGEKFDASNLTEGSAELLSRRVHCRMNGACGSGPRSGGGSFYGEADGGPGQASRDRQAGLGSGRAGTTEA